MQAVTSMQTINMQSVNMQAVPNMQAYDTLIPRLCCVPRLARLIISPRMCISVPYAWHMASAGSCASLVGKGLKIDKTIIIIPYKLMVSIYMPKGQGAGNPVLSAL